MSEHPGLEFAPQSSRSPILPSMPPLVLFTNLYGAVHRDYKRIEAASGDEPRNKLNKSNGGQI